MGILKRMRQYEIWNQWDKIAGKTLAAHAKPARWQGNRLVVIVEHATWMQELSYLKAELLDKIRTSIPNIPIADIRFEIGKIPKEMFEPTSTPPLPPLSPDEEEFIEQAMKEIKDEEAREAAGNLMTKDFKQKKRAKKG
jgi:hypothetical protein